MNKIIALILSVIIAFTVLLLVSYFWVLIEVDGTLFYALGAATGFFTGKYVYAFLKKKYKLK